MNETEDMDTTTIRDRDLTGRKVDRFYLDNDSRLNQNIFILESLIYRSH